MLTLSAAAALLSSLLNLSPERLSLDGYILAIGTRALAMVSVLGVGAVLAIRFGAIGEHPGNQPSTRRSPRNWAGLDTPIVREQRTSRAA